MRRQISCCVGYLSFDLTCSWKATLAISCRTFFPPKVSSSGRVVVENSSGVKSVTLSTKLFGQKSSSNFFADFQNGRMEPHPYRMFDTTLRRFKSWSRFNKMVPFENSDKLLSSSNKNSSISFCAAEISDSLGMCQLMPKLWMSPGLPQSWKK